MHKKKIKQALGWERVRARNFARAWSFVQASQALPLVCGIPFTGKIYCHIRKYFNSLIKM
jgi:hypothetical protein